MLQAVWRINRAIERGVATDTVKELMCPEAQLPRVYPFASAVYQQELAVLQKQQQGVSPGGPKQLGKWPEIRRAGLLPRSIMAASSGAHSQHGLQPCQVGAGKEGVAD